MDAKPPWIWRLQLAMISATQVIVTDGTAGNSVNLMFFFYLPLIIYRRTLKKFNKTMLRSLFLSRFNQLIGSRPEWPSWSCTAWELHRLCCLNRYKDDRKLRWTYMPCSVWRKSVSSTRKIRRSPLSISWQWLLLPERTLCWKNAAYEALIHFGRVPMQHPGTPIRDSSRSL